MEIGKHYTLGLFFFSLREKINFLKIYQHTATKEVHFQLLGSFFSLHGVVPKAHNMTKFTTGGRIHRQMVPASTLGVNFPVQPQLQRPFWPDSALSLHLLHPLCLWSTQGFGRANQDIWYSCFDDKFYKPTSVLMTQNQYSQPIASISFSQLFYFPSGVYNVSPKEIYMLNTEGIRLCPNLISTRESHAQYFLLLYN